MDIYQQNILEHYHHPHHQGDLANSDSSAEAANPLCGDKVVMSLKIVNDKIADLAWHGEGCVLTQASASLLSDYVLNKSLSDAQKLSSDDLIKLLGVTLGPNRLRCALLPLEALQKALEKN